MSYMSEIDAAARAGELYVKNYFRGWVCTHCLASAHKAIDLRHTTNCNRFVNCPEIMGPGEAAFLRELDRQYQARFINPLAYPQEANAKGGA